MDTAYWASLQSSGMDRPASSPTQAQELWKSWKLKASDSGGEYARHLSELGHEVKHVIANCPVELGADRRSKVRFFRAGWRHWEKFSRLPIFRQVLYEKSRLVRQLITTAEQFRPDLTLVMNINLLSPGVGRRLAQVSKVLVGQIASPLPPRKFFRYLNHVVSAHPGVVALLNEGGITASYLPLFVRKRDLIRHPPPFENRPIDVSFVGSVGRVHLGALPLLRAFAKSNFAFALYSPTNKFFLWATGLGKASNPPVWGHELSRVYANSKVVINRHIGMSKGYSVNYRMFEATGAGALLLTEETDNLSELFPAEAVITYRNRSEALEKLKWALANPSAASQVAKFGWSVSSSKHTAKIRVEKLNKLFESLLLDGSKSR